MGTPQLRYIKNEDTGIVIGPLNYSCLTGAYGWKFSVEYKAHFVTIHIPSHAVSKFWGPQGVEELDQAWYQAAIIFYHKLARYVDA